MTIVLVIVVQIELFPIIVEDKLDKFMETNSPTIENCDPFRMV